MCGPETITGNVIVKGKLSKNEWDTIEKLQTIDPGYLISHAHSRWVHESLFGVKVIHAIASDRERNYGVIQTV